MTAALWFRSYDQFRDINGKAYAGAIAYFFDGGTTTPRVVYQDNGLTTPWGSSVTADASGYFPGVFLPDGLYNFLVTSSTGAQIVSAGPIDPMPYVATGGGGGTVDPTTIFQTGDFLWGASESVRTGWVRSNGRTIGNPASGATERANSDCQALYLYLWNAYTDTICPVGGGRGATALADWSANKTIQTIDMRGASAIGTDGMGNSPASLFSAVPFTTGNATTAGSTAGENGVVLTTAQLPSHTHTGTTSTDPGHTHNYNFPTTSNTYAAGGGSGLVGPGSATATTTGGSHNHTFTTAATGTDAAHNTVQRSVLGCWFMKL